MLNMIFLGPPGTGKGTVAQGVSDEFGFVQISTGDLIRAEVKSGSEFGEQLKTVINEGKLVSDEIVEKILENKLKEVKDSGKYKGVIFDGFPRTVPQAEELENILARLGEKLAVVVLIESPDELIIKRLTSRRMCRGCGKIYNLITIPSKVEGVCDDCQGELYQRDDDKEEVVRDRLKEYAAKTFPLIDFYESKGLLKKYDGSVGPEESIASAKKIIEELE